MTPYEIIPFGESGEHSYHRRSFHHDYHAPFIYHIILKKARGCELFGLVEGDARISPGKAGCARIKETGLGKIIAKAIIHLPFEYPVIKLYQFCVMPDHVHLLLQVLFKTDKHLDFYIDRLKAWITEKYTANNPSGAGKEIFEPGYCDKPLYDNRSLDRLFRYIRENPHRLGVRKQFPHFFERIRQLKIGDEMCEAYGNVFLLRNPDKEAVKISRSFTAEMLKQKESAWLSASARGTILVSPFISSKEKSVRTKAEEMGAKIILITHETFPERFKPHAHDFALCAEGRLLIISLGLPSGATLTRSLCNRMNSLAQFLSI